MELFEVLRNRRSVRHFTAECIPDERLEQLVKAGASAPSAGNKQPWVFAVIREPGNLNRLRAAAPGIIGAPAAVIAICHDRSHAGDKLGILECEMDLLSLGAAMQNLLLAAHDKGLGACAIGSFHAPSARSILTLPEHLEPKLLIALGHPMRQPKAPRHRPLTETCFFERWEESDEQ